MREVRNGNGKLVAMIDEATGTVIIIQRGCVTKLRLNQDKKIEVINSKKQTT